MSYKKGLKDYSHSAKTVLHVISRLFYEPVAHSPDVVVFVHIINELHRRKPLIVTQKFFKKYLLTRKPTHKLWHNFQSERSWEFFAPKQSLKQLDKEFQKVRCSKRY